MSILWVAPGLLTNKAPSDAAFAVHWVYPTETYHRNEIDGVVLAVDGVSSLESTEWNTWVQSPFPVLCILKAGFKSFPELANKYPWAQFILEEESETDRQKALENFLEAAARRKKDVSWGKEISNKNRELEVMTSALEEKIKEETVSFETSHKEEKLNLQLNRRLVIFLQVLLKAQSLQEGLAAFKSAIAGSEAWGQVFLISKKFIPGNEPSNDSDLKGYLAAQVGRPLLNPQVHKMEFPVGLNAYLIIECPRPEKLTAVEKDFSQKLTTVFENAVGRFLLDEAIENHVHLWEIAFDEINEPIALISQDFEVLRSNQKFLRNGQWKNPRCFEVFASRASPCPGCPLVEAKNLSELNLPNEIWNVSSSEVKNTLLGKRVFIHQYHDLTRERQLMQQWIQSEKLSALGKLAGHLAHELNNPLGGIRSQAQILLSEITEDTP
ncbi:MAG: hypothetical protein V4736_09615, partial [Bdellovibrionota bacterium]